MVLCGQVVSQVLEAHSNALAHRFPLNQQYGLYSQLQHYPYSTGLFIIPLFRFHNATVDINQVWIKDPLILIWLPYSTYRILLTQDRAEDLWYIQVKSFLCFAPRSPPELIWPHPFLPEHGMEQFRTDTIFPISNSMSIYAEKCLFYLMSFYFMWLVFLSSNNHFHLLGRQPFNSIQSKPIQTS